MKRSAFTVLAMVSALVAGGAEQQRHTEPRSCRRTRAAGDQPRPVLPAPPTVGGAQRPAELRSLDGALRVRKGLPVPEGGRAATVTTTRELTRNPT